MKETEEELQSFIFKSDKWKEAANISFGWPEGRGIYLNNDRNLIVWVN